VVLYALVQTSIVNFKDLLAAVFNIDLGEEITWQLLPLALRTPIDPIEYISGKAPGSGKQAKPAVQQFLKELLSATQEVENAVKDTGRLLTVFTVKLESRKKIEDADVVVGITKATESPGPLTVVKTVDPNISHPLRQSEVVQKIPTLHGERFTSYTFQAVGWKHSLKTQPLFCWQAKEGFLTRYSNDVIAFVTRLSAEDVRVAVQEYRLFLKKKKTTSK
jgi:hypothetical protein